MDVAATILSIAREQSLLVDDTEQLQVTSLTVVELVLALEEALSMEIPNSEMTAANFKSVSSVVEMVNRLRAKAG